MQPDLTIAICAYNAVSRIEPVIRALGSQRILRETQWEFLFLDNASTDGTAEFVRKLAEEVHLPVRIIHEPRPGKVFAIRDAVREAAAPILSFVDDDNVVPDNWVEGLLSFMNQHPRAGIIGPRIQPIFEDPASRPPDFDEKYANALAVRDMGPAPLRLVPPAHDGPPGAGMTGRTSLFRTILFDVTCRLVGHKGNQLGSGEDSEIALIAHRLGWELWYVPELRMGHVLPPRRLNEAYLHRLIAEGARAEPWLNYLRGKRTRQSRWHYAIRGVTNLQTSVKMRGLAILRKDNASQYQFWADLYKNRGLGYLDLAQKYPFAKFESSLAAASSAAPAAGAAPAGRSVAIERNKLDSAA